MQAVERITGEMWPGVPVIPIMSGGYTDSRWLRNAGIPAYGVSGLFSEPAQTAACTAATSTSVSSKSTTARNSSTGW